MSHGLPSFSSEGLTVFSYNFLLILTKQSLHFLKSIKMDTKNVPSIKVDETDWSTTLKKGNGKSH